MVKKPKKIFKKVVEVIEDSEEDESSEEEEVIVKRKVIKKSKPAVQPSYNNSVEGMSYQLSQQHLRNKISQERLSTTLNHLTNSLSMQYY